jgi:hypothetical protein
MSSRSRGPVDFPEHLQAALQTQKPLRLDIGIKQRVPPSCWRQGVQAQLGPPAHPVFAQFISLVMPDHAPGLRVRGQDPDIVTMLPKLMDIIGRRRDIGRTGQHAIQAIALDRAEASAMAGLGL